MGLQKIENELEDLNLPYVMDLSPFYVIQNPEFLDPIHGVGLVVNERG